MTLHGTFAGHVTRHAYVREEALAFSAGSFPAYNRHRG